MRATDRTLSSRDLFDRLAPTYHEHFEVPHRRAYDDLAWECVLPLLPSEGPIVDVGCGVGRWVPRFLALGYDVIGIEHAPVMVSELRRFVSSPHFRLIQDSMETAELPEASAGLVVAMGSLQYAHDPEAVVARFARWVRPGGAVVVLVDSLLALVLELVRLGRVDEALERARTREGVWATDGAAAACHLFDRRALEETFAAAGLEHVEVKGLLVAGTALGREELAARLAEDRRAHLTLERELLREPGLADLGKQLLVAGRRARDKSAPP